MEELNHYYASFPFKEPDLVGCRVDCMPNINHICAKSYDSHRVNQVIKDECCKTAYKSGPEKQRVTVV